MGFSTGFDALILGCAFFGLAVFAVAQLLLFRFISPESVLKWLIKLIAAGGLSDISAAVLLSWKNFDAGLLEVTFFSVLSLAIYLMLTYLYVVGIFGPYESSVRLRILREIYSVSPKGMSLEGLLSRYSAAWILERRMNRFISAGDVTFDGKTYSLRKQKNFFVFADNVSAWIRKLTGGDR